MIARAPIKTQPIPFSNPMPIGEADLAPPRDAIPRATLSWGTPALNGTHKISAAPSRPEAAPKPARPAAVPAVVPVPTARRASHELNARYLGGGTLCVRSSVTGRLYRFERPGTELRIDSRDRLMLGRIPELLVG